MNSNSAPRLSKLPFLVGDVLLLVTAGWLATQGGVLDLWKSALVVAAVALGAWLAVLPFIIQFRADVAASDSIQLASATEQLGDLKQLAQQIASASAEWQHVQKSTFETVAAANEIAEKMITESRNFGEVLGQMNETEKKHLRLEVDKLRRTEGDWLQVVVRLFDHIYALEQAGSRSGQRNVADQLSRFQNACRDVARRIGFVSVIPPTGVPFNEKEHHLLDGQSKVEGAVVGSIVAPGYTFQGQLLRLPAVSLQTAEQPQETTQEADAEPQLPLGDAPGAGA
jgi:molecular chaperone GrpE (heat shock protein)